MKGHHVVLLLIMVGMLAGGAAAVDRQEIQRRATRDEVEEY